GPSGRSACRCPSASELLCRSTCRARRPWLGYAENLGSYGATTPSGSPPELHRQNALHSIFRLSSPTSVFSAAWISAVSAALGAFPFMVIGSDRRATFFPSNLTSKL